MNKPQTIIWKPIETAPKDETEVIGYHSGMVSIIWFTDGEWCWQDNYLSLLGEPTHWMPLPKPPKESA